MPPFIILSAFTLDLVLGDPAWLPHPVRLIGKAVSGIEKVLLSPEQSPARDMAAGALLVSVVALSAFAVSYFAVVFAYRYLGHIGGAAVTVYLAYTTISVKGLADAAREVIVPLEKRDIEAARHSLSMVVGRDTAVLDEAGVTRAAIETVAENTSDGAVAPLMYLALGGAPLAMTYKAINTMDSMLGYKSGKYRYFGRAAARLDDLANFVPARLTGMLMVAGSFLLSKAGYGYSWQDSWRVFKRDRRNHPSPNSGHPEAAAAGALNVRLGGESSYFGVKSVKPYIGDPAEPVTAAKAGDAVRLMYAASFLALVVAMCAAHIISF